MTSKLEVLKAELDALEAADAYDAPQYDWLCEQVEWLTREEAAKPPTPEPTPATQADDPIRALEAEMQAALANPERFTDAQRDELVTRYNAAVMAAGQFQQPEAVDLGALQRDMLTAQADPSKLDDEQRAELLRRYDQATRRRPTARADSGRRESALRGRGGDAPPGRPGGRGDRRPEPLRPRDETAELGRATGGARRPGRAGARIRQHQQPGGVIHMARNPSSADGSAPAIGELVTGTGTSGSRPRTAHRGERVA